MLRWYTIYFSKWSVVSKRLGKTEYEFKIMHHKNKRFYDVEIFFRNLSRIK